MTGTVAIESGFAGIGAGLWLMSRSQPAVCSGTAKRLRRKGWAVRDRSALDLVETVAWAKCADQSRPFLTHIPCAAEVVAVSDKVLVAPATARKDAKTLRVVPMSVKGAMPVTEFSQDWVVMATASRTTRIVLAEGETASVRLGAAVAWTTKMPTGFCPKLSVWDVLLPRGPRDLLFTFYGPGVVWAEGSGGRRAEGRRANGGWSMAGRSVYVV